MERLEEDIMKRAQERASQAEEMLEQQRKVRIVWY